MTQQVDTLFINALVLTMDKDFTQYFPGAVAVQVDHSSAPMHAWLPAPHAVEQSRLGIPLLIGLDIIHGHRTLFPIPLAEKS